MTDAIAKRRLVFIAVGGATFAFIVFGFALQFFQQRNPTKGGITSGETNIPRQEEKGGSQENVFPQEGFRQENWQELVSFEGDENATTPQFSISSQWWKIAWTVYTSPEFLQRNPAPSFEILAYRVGEATPVETLVPKSSLWSPEEGFQGNFATSKHMEGEGDFYFVVHAKGVEAWNIAVKELVYPIMQ